MEKKLIDRRVQRTRRLFLDALVSLIEERGYEAITVQNILDKADLGRSTFYAHFRGKEDLLLSGFADLRRAFERHRQEAAAGKGGQGLWDLGLFWFRHIESDRRVCKALIGTPGSEMARNRVRRFLSRFLSTLVREQMRPGALNEKDASAVSDLVVHYAAGSLLALTTWWLDHRMPFTADEMSDLFVRLTRPGIESVLKQTPVYKK
ncbi:MAG: TetR/AcrR family transcriptional regulator, partial [Betaproteobacteria bacterium]